MTGLDTLVKLDIHAYGDPVLREKAAPVRAVDEEVRAFARDLIETMRAEQGVGLAAQQVGRAIAVCVIEVPVEYDTDDAGQRLNPGLAMPMVFINPEIITVSRKTDGHEEGCLSFPGIRGSIQRHVEITVRYLDEQGRPQERRLVDFVARVVQHEIDHLNGVLFIDRMSAAKRFALKKRLNTLKRETEERLGLA